jgi:hypothetical protein
VSVVCALLVVPAAAQVNRGAAPGSCDRACLTGMADAYFAALVAHDPSKAAMAPTAKFTENTQVLKVGEGLWATASEAPSNFKVYVPDPVAGQLGGIVIMKDAGKPIQLALRLKIVNKQITEAEHIISRNANEANFKAPRPGLLASLPPAERLPRDLMLLFMHGYYDALEQSDGTAVPFAEDCIRRENGMQTAGGVPPAGAGRGGGGGGFGVARGCEAQINSRFFYYITSIDLRRVWIADEEKGLVFGLSMFRHPMEEKVFTVLGPDGTPNPRDMSKQNPFDFESIHIIKIQGNKIHDIEAMGISLPLRSKNGWSDFWR